MATDLTTPVGRLVQGSVLELQKVLDKQGKQKIDPKTGLPVPDRVYLAIAIQKTPGVTAWWMEPPPRNADGTVNNFWQDLYRAGQTGYPTHFNPQTGVCVHPRFAWKIMDGDGTDNDGKSNAGKEGFAGHWIVKFGGNYAPKLIHNGAYIDNPKYVKRGDFVRVFGNATPNIGAEVPGLYLNPNGVEFIAYGQEIKSGPDVLALAAKAGGVAQLPAGASLTPLAGANPGIAPQPQAQPGVMAMPGSMPAPAQTAAMPTPGVMQQPQPQPGVMAMPGMAQQPVQPNHAFVQNAVAGAMPTPGGMPTPGAMPQPVAQPVFTMTAAAGGFTREQYHAQGYTDAVLLQSGFMVQTA